VSAAAGRPASQSSPTHTHTHHYTLQRRLHSQDATLPSHYALAVLGAVWRCVLPDARARAEFLAQDGVDGLALLLEAGNKHIRPLLLSVLSDLLQDPRAVPFFLEWRSPTARTTSLPHLLLTIWEELGNARGITDAQGVLATTSRPLAGTVKSLRGTGDGCAGGCASAASGLPPSRAVAIAGAAHQALQVTAAASNAAAGRLQTSLQAAGHRQPAAAGAAAYGFLHPERRQSLERIAAASDVDSLMTKIYTCLSSVGFESVAALLAPRQLAHLAVVREYVRFRQGEVWQDIRATFEAEGLQPSEEDRCVPVPPGPCWGRGTIC